MTVDVEEARKTRSSGWTTDWGTPIVCVLIGIISRIIAFIIVENGASLTLFPDGYCRWDCAYYISIATSNYQTTIDQFGRANWAFFPLLPAFIALLHSSTRLSLEMSGLVVPGLTTLIASRFAFSLCTSPRHYQLFCAAACFGPASLYYLIPYSESMFLLFTVLLAVHLQRNDAIGAGISGALLSASRVVGIFAGAAILTDFVARYLNSGGKWRMLPRHLWQRPEVLLGLAIVPLGVGAFAAALYFRVGDGLAFTHVQRLWYRVPTNPVMAIWSGLLSGGEERIDAVSALLGLAGSITMILRREYAMGVFCALCVAAPLILGLESMYRFVIALAPFWLLLANWLSARRWISNLGFAALLMSGFLTNVAWLSDVHYLV